MCDWPSLMTSSNCRLVWLLLSDWCNFSRILLAVEIPCSWVEPASGAPDGRFPHSARAQGVGARGKTAMWEFPTLSYLRKSVECLRKFNTFSTSHSPSKVNQIQVRFQAGTSHYITTNAYLKVRTRDTSRNLSEQRLLNFGKL
jgi:hypothetical protein